LFCPTLIEWYQQEPTTAAEQPAASYQTPPVKQRRTIAPAPEPAHPSPDWEVESVTSSIMAAADRHCGNKLLSVNEVRTFLRGTIHEPFGEWLTGDRLKHFRSFDRDRDGALNSAELTQAICTPFQRLVTLTHADLLSGGRCLDGAAAPPGISGSRDPWPPGAVPKPELRTTHPPSRSRSFARPNPASRPFSPGAAQERGR